jgi:predicted TIM-barrel fold metal-dependent hydrolase
MNATLGQSNVPLRSVGVLDRRGFLRVGMAAWTASTLPSAKRHASAQDKEKPMFQVIDSHQHLWDLKRFRLPWTDTQKSLARDFTMRDYLAATEGIPIAGSVYLEVDLEPSQQQAEADYITELCRRREGPLVAAVVSGRPASDRFADYVRPFRDHSYIRGIRQVLHVTATPPGYCLQPSFVKGIQLLGELGLSYDLCMRPTELGDAIKLVDACPGTLFILDHCGGANVQAEDQTSWRRGMEQIAKRENVACKISGIIASAKPYAWSVEDLAPIVNHSLDVFGPDRVMYGGDWPVCTLAATYRQWFDALAQIVADRPENERKRLYYDNAQHWYRLACSPRRQ